MFSMRKRENAMQFKPEVIDELLKGCGKPEDVIGENGLLKQLTKALLERALRSEMTHHLGYEKHGRGAAENARNGSSEKTIQGDFGKITVEIPRDRNGEFEPQILPKHQRRFTGFDKKILSMYARGMTERDIRDHLEEIYGVEVSAELISNVTDAVVEELKAWQSRPLEPMYPIIFLDALYVKMRHEGRVENRAVYVAIGINVEGRKEVLGLWTSGNEGAKFWLGVLTELRNRGVRDVLVVCVDGLKGFPQAIETVFARAEVQLCVVHMIRASLNYVNWKDRRVVVADLKPVYRAATATQAEMELGLFEEKWGKKYGASVKVWKENWERIKPFYSFPEELRKIVYTTNAVESLNSSLRKVTKNRGSFPSEEAALKLLYLALKNVSAKWDTVQDWKAALNRMEILWGDRIKAAQASAA
jgi:putative transposase